MLRVKVYKGMSDSVVSEGCRHALKDAEPVYKSAGTENEDRFTRRLDLEFLPEATDLDQKAWSNASVETNRDVDDVCLRAEYS